MSINQKIDESKASSDNYTEEEFDLVPKGGNGLFSGFLKHGVILGLILLAAGAAFGIGRISHYEKVIQPIEVKSSDTPLPFATASANEAAVPAAPTSQKSTKQTPVVQSTPAANTTASTTDGTVVASKTGTKYYFPWCGGAKRILDANKVYYASTALARAAGLTPSTACKGLQ